MKISRYRHWRCVMQDNFALLRGYAVAFLVVALFAVALSCSRSCARPKTEAPEPEPDYPVIIVERNWDLDPFIGILKIEQEAEREE